ncbi:hypothetical protein SAMN04488577_2082 [Bacillus sp. cl95]|nr:hypothetical protein SAMN02799634_103451 [Bacillus sp. UNCCL13]SFQ81710.1 hypothetical protein SAMN04488577_2082 [Bacillus sp. cl95]
MKYSKLIITTSCLFVLIAGIIGIINFVEQNNRPIFVLILGSIVLVLQQILLRAAKNKLINFH